jgi:hypothetical protein
MLLSRDNFLDRNRTDTNRNRTDRDNRHRHFLQKKTENFESVAISKIKKTFFH